MWKICDWTDIYGDFIPCLQQEFLFFQGYIFLILNAKYEVLRCRNIFKHKAIVVQANMFSPAYGRSHQVFRYKALYFIVLQKKNDQIANICKACRDAVDFIMV